jgi:hypothetical protein
MTLQDLGSIGELVGALATIATLAYLALQIRGNTRAVRSQARQHSQSTTRSWTLAVAQDEPLADIFRRGLASFESLEPTEQIRFTFLMSQIIGASELAFQDREDGVSNPKQLERALAGMLPLLRTPGGRAYWKVFASRAGYPDEFRSLIDAELRT